MSLVAVCAILVAAPVLLWPVVVWLHQIGHVLAVLVLTQDPVIVQWFGEAGNWRFESVGRMGRIHWRRRQSFRYASTVPMYGFYVGYSRRANTSRWRYIAVDAAGPLVCLALGAINSSWLWLITARPSRPNAVVYGIVIALPNLMALVPFSYPSWMGWCKGTPSDGERIRRHLRGAIEKPLVLQYERKYGFYLLEGARQAPGDQVPVYWL